MFSVTLESVGNPDYGQNPLATMPGVRNHTAHCETLEQCADECRRFIERHDLGGGNWSGGEVLVMGQQVARISFNGRIWVDDGSGKFELPFVSGLSGLSGSHAPHGNPALQASPAV